MPQPFSSPWLAQLRQERPHWKLEKNIETDVAVVGAGIAGVMTAYEILKLTSLRVVLLDAGRIAHGATGRNAGQVVSYFERPLSDIANAFGAEMAVAGQMLIESAWGQLEDVMGSCRMKTHLYHCKGYAGFSTVAQVIDQLKEKEIRTQAGLSDDPLMMKVDDALLREIPNNLRHHIMPVPHSVVLRALETDDSAFMAAEASMKGCMNSAHFCEELVGWMSEYFGDRLQIAEHLPVEQVVLKNAGAELRTTGPVITAQKVVLCTNGFENFEIVSETGPEINTSFHHTVRGTIGYMAGYIDEPDQPATAVSYHGKGDFHAAYHYLTRRPYEHDGGKHSLVCIGGPERVLPDRAVYDPSAPFPADIEEELDRELRETYRDLPPSASKRFLWQGLMGYTPNNIRRIGFEPRNRTLLYNLGCNGVGILPSVYGGKRIAELLKGIHLPRSIFDPETGAL